MPQNMQQANINLLDQWRALGNTGDLPVGWSGPSGGGSGDFGLDKILDAFKQRQEERNRLVNEFNAKNPFVYDEILAAKSLEAKEQLDLEKAKEGSAQAGLFNSGQMERGQGLIQKEAGQNLGDFLTGAQRQQANIQRTTGRNLEDLQREESIKTRDLAREQDVQTKLLSSDLTKEAATKRGYALQQYLGPFAETNNDYDILGLGTL